MIKFTGYSSLSFTYYGMKNESWIMYVSFEFFNCWIGEESFDAINLTKTSLQHNTYVAYKQQVEPNDMTKLLHQYLLKIKVFEPRVLHSHAR